MAKALIQVNKFEGGLVNYYDPRDLPENSLHEATGVMCDITGKIRSMGGPIAHTDFPNDLTGNFTAGYGLFSFTADHSLFNCTAGGDATQIAKEVDYLAFQNGPHINIYETTAQSSSNAATSGVLTSNVVTLAAVSAPSEIRPVFYYVDGCLRVNDGLLSNETPKYPKALRFIKKRWFASLSHMGSGEDSGYKIGPNWFQLDAPVFPPSHIYNYNRGQLICNGDGYGALSTANGDDAIQPDHLSFGNIHLEVAVDTGVTGEWVGDAELQFGMSFVYDDGQESPITQFKAADGTNAIKDTSSSADNHSLKFKIAVGFDSTTDTVSNRKAFDPRVAGVRVYLVGDSLGLKDDPEYLLYFHWGTDNTNDKPYMESHAGDILDFNNFAAQATVSANYAGVKTANYLIIKKLPSVTYRHLTGVNHKEVSTAARYKTAVVINRRTFAGGVKRLMFDTAATVGGTGQTYNDIYTNGNCRKQCKIVDAPSAFDPEPDKMLISEENQFDIFPASNEIDVAINDGEQITQLMAFADRVLQFKNKTLYIINISKDVEYLESQHKYMGVEHPYQTCMTEYGPAWVNRNGCFLFDGEKITNLIIGKLNPTEGATSSSRGWYDFIGANGMIGYIQELKQLLVMHDPVGLEISDTSSGSDVMIYDMQTGSWTHGKDLITGTSKSNIIMNYDDTCMYLSESINTSEIVDLNVPTPINYGVSAQWTIPSIDQDWSASSSAVRINSVNITPTFNYPAGAQDGETFRAFLSRMISQQVGDDLITYPEENSNIFRIERHPSKIEETGEPYANYTMDLVNAPTATYVDVAPASVAKTTEIGGIKFDPVTYDDNWGTNFMGSGIGATEYVFGPGMKEQYAIDLSTTTEVTNNTWETSGQYPAQVMLYHMHLDTFSVYPLTGLIADGSNISWEMVQDGNPWYQGLPGLPDLFLDYRVDTNSDGVEESTLLQNPAACQLKLTKNGGGAFTSTGGAQYEGVSTIMFDMSLAHVGYHETESTFEPGAIGMNRHPMGFPHTGVPSYNDPEGTWGSGYASFNHYTYLFYKQVMKTSDNMASTGIKIKIPHTILNATHNQGSNPITAIAEDSLINGSGDALVIDQDQFSYNVNGVTKLLTMGEDQTIWSPPSVVFRLVRSGVGLPRKMYITMLGNYEGTFQSGQNLVISNCSKSENNFGGHALIVESITVIRPYQYIYSGIVSAEWMNAGYTGDNAVIAEADRWGDAAKVTCLVFDYSEQSDEVKALWDSAYSYGDHNTVRFTYSGTTTMTVSNSGNPVVSGVGPTSSEHTIHPRRIGDYTRDTVYKNSLKGDNDVTYTLNYETHEGDSDYSVAIQLRHLFQAVKDSQADSMDSVGLYTVSNNDIVIEDSGLTVKFSGDHTKYIHPGDVFLFESSTQANGTNDLAANLNRLYRIKSVSAYAGGVTPVTICNSANDIYGGADSVSTFHPVQENDGDTANGTYNNYIAIFGVVKLNGGNPWDISNPLEVTSWTSLGLEVMKFNNNYTASYPQLLDVRTRDLDFGVPSALKVFYKVIVNAKTMSGTKVRVAYNGSQNYHDLGMLQPSVGWAVNEFYFDTVNRTPFKAYSIQLQFTNQFENIAGIDFELNDVTLIYRSI